MRVGPEDTYPPNLTLANAAKPTGPGKYPPNDRSLPFLFHEAGDGAHEIVFGENLEMRISHIDEDRRILMTKHVGDALDGRGLRNLRQRLAHPVSNDGLTKDLALHGEGEYLAFVDCANRNILLE